MCPRTCPSCLPTISSAYNLTQAAFGDDERFWLRYFDQPKIRHRETDEF